MVRSRWSVREAVRADHGLDVGVGVAERLFGRVDDLPAEWGQADEFGPMVGWVGLSVDVPLLFEKVDEIRHALLGDVGGASHVCDPGTVFRDVGEHLAVGGGEAGVSGGAQPVDELQPDRALDVLQEQEQVEGGRGGGWRFALAAGCP